jgi:integrase/recombinase XerD
MAKKPGPWPPDFSTDADPQSMRGLATPFVEWMRVRGYSEVTIHRRFNNLRIFFDWCELRSLTRPQDVTLPVLERYQKHLFHYRGANGKPLSLRSQHIYLSTLRAYFLYLARKNHILNNPAADMDLPKFGRQVPRHILTSQEAETILNTPDIKTLKGLRDRAILETFYSTGIRRFELVKLNLYDLERTQGTVMVKEGKCRMDRVIPIGSRALAWVQKYLREVRPVFVREPDEGAMFLQPDGARMTPSTLSHIVAKYVNKSGVRKSGSCHMFRHTMATLMLEGGADVRFIQQMLGHARLETTTIYTHVSIEKLKEVHRETHPGATLKSKKSKKINSD